MHLDTFLLEDYYGKYEFKTKYMLSSSDPESWSLNEILRMANKEEQVLWETQCFGYTEIKGLPTLRKTIARSLYPSLTADNILCFAGAEEGIFCSLLTLCSSQDHIIVLGPCYQSLAEIPKFTGATVTTIDLKEENNWSIDIEAIKSSIQTNTKMLIINFPHNPTGQIITSNELTELIQLLNKHNIWLFSDEVYHLLGRLKDSWAKPAATLYDKAISLGVMSKAYGMPGLRVGWIACQNQNILQQIEKTKHYTSLCNSGPAELISLIALRNKDIILARNNDIVAKNLLLLDSFFKKYAHLFSWVRPQGGCTGFVKYVGPETVDMFCSRLIDQAHVLLLPGSVYSVSSNHFRIGFGRRNMLEALTELEKFITSDRRD